MEFLTYPNEDFVRLDLKSSSWWTQPSTFDHEEDEILNEKADTKYRGWKGKS